MIPIDTEFITMCFLYGIVAIVVYYEWKQLVRKWQTYVHSMFFVTYTGILVYLFSDAENFKYGGSLVGLFYGALFPIAHLLIFVLQRTFRLLRQNL